MKLFTFINRNHHTADAWRQVLSTKEDKKREEATVPVAPATPLQAIQNFHQQHIICTAESLRKTAAEKLQIQQVQEELEKVRVIPELAI